MHRPMLSDEYLRLSCILLAMTFNSWIKDHSYSVTPIRDTIHPVHVKLNIFRANSGECHFHFLQLCCTNTSTAPTWTHTHKYATGSAQIIESNWISRLCAVWHQYMWQSLQNYHLNRMQSVWFVSGFDMSFCASKSRPYNDGTIDRKIIVGNKFEKFSVSSDGCLVFHYYYTNWSSQNNSFTVSTALAP